MPKFSNPLKSGIIAHIVERRSTLGRKPAVKRRVGSPVGIAVVIVEKVQAYESSTRAGSPLSTLVTSDAML